ncbi:ABC transporter [Pseudofrankia sp. EUN1h]|nr:ABC transporter [Pseudofrankia sp. EUN1h]
MAVMAALGLLSGVLEFLAMVFLITLAAGHTRVGWALPGRLADGRGGLAVAALLVTAASAVVSVVAARHTTRIGATTVTTLRGRLAHGYLAADWPAQRAEPVGRLQELAFTDAGQVSLGAQHAADAVAGGLRLATFTVAAFAVSPLPAGALFAGVGAVAVVTARLGGRRAHSANRQAVEAASGLAAALTETTTVAGELRIFNARGAAGEALARRAELAGLLQGKIMFHTTVAPRLARDLAVLALTAVLLAVLWLDDLALPTLGLVILLTMRALGQAAALVGTTHQVRERLTHLSRIDEHLARWAPARPAGRRPCPPAAGRLRLQGVDVVHPGADRPALTGLDLALRPGERLGVVGRSGAGKSTLAAVLLGLLEPSRGRVLVDGVDRAEIDPAQWFGRVAAVGQQPALVSGTVADNIRFLRTGIDDAAVRTAAGAAGLGPELAAWPAGVDHPAGPHGGALSGGQRQRVTLARALARPADLLVLDEPSSALDADAELALRAALAAVDRSTTVVVIAHRLSTVLACDRIAVLEDGRLEALGSPTELAATNRYFRDALRLALADLPEVERGPGDEGAAPGALPRQRDLTDPGRPVAGAPSRPPSSRPSPGNSGKPDVPIGLPPARVPSVDAPNLYAE